MKNYTMSCTAPECERRVETYVKKQLCNAHYLQQARGKPFTKPRERAIGICKFQTCDRARSCYQSRNMGRIPNRPDQRTQGGRVVRYVVRKEGLSWIVRGSNGHYYAARRTHADAIQWADTLATTPARRRAANAITRIRAAISRIEGR